MDAGQMKNLRETFRDMTPDEMRKAARTIKPKVLFPYHYSQTPIKQVADLLTGSGIDVRIRNYQ